VRNFIVPKEQERFWFLVLPVKEFFFFLVEYSKIVLRAVCNRDESMETLVFAASLLESCALHFSNIQLAYTGRNLRDVCKRKQ
jgi:hypothetical protein